MGMGVILRLLFELLNVKIVGGLDVFFLKVVM